MSKSLPPAAAQTTPQTGLTTPAPVSDEFTFRPYRAGDERELVELFKSAFGTVQTEADWRWKLRQDGSVDNVWLATTQGKPVFQYAGIPTRFWMCQAPARCMVSVDTMTAPEYRRRGLLTQVGRRAYEAWQHVGIAFVIGLPNEQWGSRTGALGWQSLFALQWMVRPLRPEAILARRLRLPILRRATWVANAWNRHNERRVPIDRQVTVSPIIQADDSFDTLWNDRKTDWAFSAVRDRRWIHWRFFSSPSHVYALDLAQRDGRPTGYSAHRVINTREHTIAQLAELFAGRDDDATRSSLLGELIHSLRAQNVEALFTLAIPGTAYFSWLRRAGFVPRHAFTVQIVPLSPELPMHQLRDPNLWNLSGADFDVI